MRILSDPLSLFTAGSSVDNLEQRAREQGEDILQVEIGAGNTRMIVDLGWYTTKYTLNIIGDDWSTPLHSSDYPNITTALEDFRGFIQKR